MSTYVSTSIDINVCKLISVFTITNNFPHQASTMFYSTKSFHLLICSSFTRFRNAKLISLASLDILVSFSGSIYIYLFLSVHKYEYTHIYVNK